MRRSLQSLANVAQPWRKSPSAPSRPAVWPAVGSLPSVSVVTPRVRDSLILRVVVRPDAALRPRPDVTRAR
jgi:hypothetical protein